MANIKSAKKRIRQNEKRRLHNRYYAKTARNLVRSIRASKDASEVDAKLPLAMKQLYTLVKMNIIHRNKAANLKSSMALHANALRA